MTTLACPGPGEWKQLLHGQVGPTESEALEQHLSGCAVCAGLVEQLQGQDPLLRVLRVEPPTLAEDERLCLGRLQEELRQRLAGQGAPTTPPVNETPTFGPYRVVGLLGQGGMGTVYAAVDPCLNRRVAIKVLKPELAGAAHHRERLQREARALAALRHPGIVPVFHVGEEEGNFYLVMPLLEGRSLFGQGKLPVEQVVRLGLEIARGLAAAHDKGILHRDLKPGNLWLEPGDNGPRACILDFGLARSPAPASPLTPTGTILGTPGYAAPEVLDGKPIDHRADLFSLGVILYELAAGARPYPGDTVLTYAASLKPGQHVPPLVEVGPAIPPAFSDLVSRLLQLDPEQRPAGAREVIQALEGLQAAPGPAPLQPPGRRRWLAWGVAALACMGLGAIGFLAVGLGRSGGPTTRSAEDDSGPARLLALVLADLEALPAGKREARRYLTLTHRAGDAGGLRRARAALQALPGKGPNVFQALDEDGTVLAFDLAALDWDEDDWRQVREVDPYGLDLEGNHDDRVQARMAHVRKLARCKLPFVRGDWLLAALARPPLRNQVPPRREPAGAWRELVEAYERETLDLDQAAHDLGAGTDELRRRIEAEPYLRERGKLALGSLLRAGVLTRQQWESGPFGESRFQACARTLGLGTPSRGE